MWPFFAAVGLVVLLGLLLLGERVFERARGRPKAPKRLPPP
jgi:hypothetical protein